MSSGPDAVDVTRGRRRLINRVLPRPPAAAVVLVVVHAVTGEELLEAIGGNLEELGTAGDLAERLLRMRGLEGDLRVRLVRGTQLVQADARLAEVAARALPGLPGAARIEAVVVREWGRVPRGPLPAALQAALDTARERARPLVHFEDALRQPLQGGSLEDCEAVLICLLARRGNDVRFVPASWLTEAVVEAAVHQNNTAWRHVRRTVRDHAADAPRWVVQARDGQPEWLLRLTRGRVGR